jgi:DNA repair protein RecN (Recombination protein N)
VALRRIVLRDFVIVEELDLDLASGFTVLTGETGAGKSILIDAVQLVTGARADASTIREGAGRAEVTAEFDSPPYLDAWLEAAGFDRSDTLLMRRTIDQQGKSRGWINGSPATAAQMRAIGEQLIDIHGQHAWQSLTRPEAVRGLLDAYAKVDTAPLGRRWQEWRTADKAILDARGAQDTLQRERDRLQWQIGELDKLAPQPGEWEVLNTDHGRLSNAQALLDAASGAVEALQDGDGGVARFTEPGPAPAASAGAPGARLQATGRGAGIQPGRSRGHGAWPAHLPAQDRAGPAATRTAGRTHGPLWIALARRYKRNPQELPELLASWKGELRQLDAASDLAALRSRRGLRPGGLSAGSPCHLAQARQGSAIAGQGDHHRDAGPGHGGRTLRGVADRQRPVPMQDGLEDIQFLVAGHPGSTPRPMGKVASGGELSRIALAIAVTTSELGAAQTLIFDEVDSGVGGSVAQAVGRLMRQLGRDRQVMAVTHLAQVAICADHHLVVSKQPAARCHTQLCGLGHWAIHACPKLRACWAANVSWRPRWPMPA